MSGNVGNLSVGLFGGSFDPAHSGHLHAATVARRACRLDRVWWMPSPQNPLKPSQPPWENRARTVRELRLPPGHDVSDVEVQLGTRYTVDTLHALRARHPATRFVFIMGADNWAQLPMWKSWRQIVRTVPICVVSRPGQGALRARLGSASRQFAQYRVPESQASTLSWQAPPAWTFLSTPHHPESSSRIRAATRAQAGR